MLEDTPLDVVTSQKNILLVRSSCIRIYMRRVMYIGRARPPRVQFLKKKKSYESHLDDKNMEEPFPFIIENAAKFNHKFRRVFFFRT